MAQDEELSSSALSAMSPDLLRILGMLDDDEPPAEPEKTGWVPPAEAGLENSSSYDEFIKREGELVNRAVTTEWRPPPVAGLDNSNRIGSDSDSNSDSDDSDTDSDDSDDFDAQVTKARKNQEARAEQDRRRKEDEIRMEAALLQKVREDAKREEAESKASPKPKAEPVLESEPLGPQSEEDYVPLPLPTRRMSKTEMKVRNKWKPPPIGGAQRWLEEKEEQLLEDMAQKCSKLRLNRSHAEYFDSGSPSEAVAMA